MAKKRKVNPTMKRIDAAVRLALANKREGQVIVHDGWLFAADMSTASEVPQLPNGVYIGKQLVEAFDTALKYAKDISVKGDQDGKGDWKVALFDATNTYETMALLDWRDVEMHNPNVPPTTWTVDKDQRVHGKIIYALAAKLEKKQVRYVELSGSGVMRFVSPVAVMDWWYTENVNGTDRICLNVQDLKRALLYRGGKLTKIGESDGKINFRFDDGAWLRVDQYGGPWYDDSDQIGPRFQVNGERYSGDSYRALATTLDASTRTRLESLPVTAPAGGVNGVLFGLVSEYATEMQLCSVDEPWRENRVLLTGPNYRAVLSAALTEKEAMEQGLIDPIPPDFTDEGAK